MGKVKYLSLFLFCAFFSCKKTEATHVTGFVLQTGNDKPIPFGSVFIEEVAGNHTNRIMTVQADATGFFELSFEADKDSRYGLDGMADKCQNVSQFIALSNGKANKQDLHLQPYAFINVHALKQTSDTLNLGRDILSPDTSYVYVVKGNTSSNLIYFILHNGDYVLHQVPFTITGFDTVPYLLEY